MEAQQRCRKAASTRKAIEVALRPVGCLCGLNAGAVYVHVHLDASGGLERKCEIFRHRKQRIVLGLLRSLNSAAKANIFEDISKLLAAKASSISLEIPCGSTTSEFTRIPLRAFGMLSGSKRFRQRWRANWQLRFGSATVTQPNGLTAWQAASGCAGAF